jgi:hypothetical protein
MSKRHYFGYDPAQASDWSAIAVIEHEAGVERFDVVDLYRFPKGTGYPDQVRHLGAMVETVKVKFKGDVDVIIDSTGVGKPVCDLAREWGMQTMNVLVIQSGFHGKFDRANGYYHIPKVDLITGAVIASQQKILFIAPELELASVLQTELLNYRVKISLKTGRESYGPEWRDEGTNDDLLFACCLAMFAAKKEQIMGLTNYLLVQKQHRAFVRG